MTQPIQLINQVYAVEVPDPANAIISGNVITWRKGEAQGRGFITLPPGNWQLICTAKECTEDQAKGIVKQYGKCFMDFTATEKDWDEGEVNWFDNPLDSLRSLLASKGLDINKNYVLIKKVS